MLSSSEKEYPKRSPNGVYDQNILCKNCEKKFSVWDDYASTFFLSEFEKLSEIKEYNKVVGYFKKDFDYEKLRLFFVSVLWRASISTHPFYKNVKLGAHEAKLREIIDRRIAPSSDDYACILYRFTGFSDVVPILMPLKTRSSYGLTYYRVYFGNFFIDIKVDRQPTPRKFSTGIIQAGTPLIIATTNIYECRESNIFRKIVNSPQNNKHLAKS